MLTGVDDTMRLMTFTQSCRHLLPGQHVGGRQVHTDQVKHYSSSFIVEHDANAVRRCVAPMRGHDRGARTTMKDIDQQRRSASKMYLLSTHTRLASNVSTPRLGSLIHRKFWEKWVAFYAKVERGATHAQSVKGRARPA